MNIIFRNVFKNSMPFVMMKGLELLLNIYISRTWGKITRFQKIWLHYPLTILIK